MSPIARACDPVGHVGAGRVPEAAANQGSGARRYGAPLHFAGYRVSQAAGDAGMITSGNWRRLWRPPARISRTPHGWRGEGRPLAQVCTTLFAPVMIATASSMVCDLGVITAARAP